MAAAVVVDVSEGSQNNVAKIEIANNLEDSGPFQATQLWYRIISYLKNHANLKRRWFMIRQYNNCFSGENAVNVVYHCLVEERKSSTVITSEITRIKAKKVCQSLMDNGVFEAVGHKSRGSGFVNSCVFEDSSSKLYQFVESGRNRELYSTRDPDMVDGSGNIDAHSTSMEEEQLKNCGVVGTVSDFDTVSDTIVDSSWNATPSKFLSTPSRWSACVSPFRRLRSQEDDDDFDAKSLPSSRGRGDLDSTPSNSALNGSRRRSASASRVRGFGRVLRAFGSSDLNSSDGTTLDKFESPNKSKNGKPNLLRFQRLFSSSSTSLLSEEGSSSSLSSQTLDEDSVWKQVALARLLTLIDLSFLDDILPSPRKKLPRPNSETSCLTTIPNNHRLLARLDSAPVSVDSDPQNSLSAELWVSSAQQITDSRCFLLDNPIHLNGTELKRRAFDTVWRYCSNLPSTIVPTNLISVFVAVLGLIKDGRFSVAIQALQLSVLLLPWQQRRELEQLLEFMQLATDDVSIRLKKQLTNRQFLLQQFTPAIIRCELLASDQAAILISFMLHNRQLMFKIPEEIKLEVDRILLESRMKKDSIPKPAFKYCTQVTGTSYDENASKTSNAALEDLLNSVVDNVHMTLKEKEKWIKQFRKCHPELYQKCFPGK